MRVVQKALTFDDVLLVPAHSTVLPREVNLKPQLTRGRPSNSAVGAPIPARPPVTKRVASARP